MFVRLGQGQIIDVTKECTFDWGQEPASCCAFLEVSGASGDFTDGETVTGGTSNATATVFSSYVDGGRVYVENVSGTFQAGETITGGSSNQTATVDGFVPERSWPDNIIQGSFLDSIINKDVDDYLEWESSSSGASTIAKIHVTPPSKGYYIVIPTFGTGEQIAKEFAAAVDKIVYVRAVPPYSLTDGCAASGSATQFSSFFTLYYSFIGYLENQKIQFQLYHKDKYIFRWRIHNIRVLKLVI